jgi:hypothetical protein
MKKVFQMVVRGRKNLFDEPSQIVSRIVYLDASLLTREVKDKFFEVCTTPIDDMDITYLDRESSALYVIELEVR